MIHSAHLLAALNPLVDERVFALRFQQEPLPTWPAIRYTPRGGPISADVCNGGSDDTDDIFVQVDYVAETYEQADALARAGRTALQAIAVPGLNVSAVSAVEVVVDPDTLAFIATQDFLFSGSSLD